jgi:hypothetical protein
VKVFTVTVEDRDGRETTAVETRDEQAAEAAVNAAKAADPNAMITRTEREVS